MTNEEVITYFQQLKNGTLELEEDENGYVTIPVSNDMFVQAAGPEETWAYQTSTVEIPMETGIRTFSGATKDEIVTQGLMGIMANSLKDMNETSYAADSLFGKIKRKVEKAMANTHGTDPAYWTLEDVKLPWLYNRIGIRPANSGFLRDGDRIHGTLSGNTYIEPAYNIGIINNSFATAITLEAQITNNQYIYTIYFCSEDDNFSSEDLASKISWYTKSPLYWTKFGLNDNNKRTFAYSSPKNYFHGAVSFGGYDNAYSVLGNKDHSGYNWSDTIRTLRYNQQPYLIGMVLWITDIIPQGTYKYSRCWLVPIAFDFYGNILQPLYTNDLPGTGVSANYIIPSPIADLNGNIIVRLSLPMSQAEVDYALSNNYIIVPVSCLPNDTTYIENGETPGSGT